jgi:REP element-mobilizing transposase RayT
MSDGGYKIRNQKEIHFITFAVVEWIDVFTRKLYRDIFVDSLKFCQENKALRVHAWCIMSNHVHLISSAKHGDLSSVLRDLKKFTSNEIIKAITANKTESRRDWMLKIFKEQGAMNPRNSEFQFWRQDNQPKELFGPAFTVQKIDYIHNNPVAAGIVDKPEDYLYSSARNYHFGKQCGLVKVVFL